MKEIVRKFAEPTVLVILGLALILVGCNLSDSAEITKSPVIALGSVLFYIAGAFACGISIVLLSKIK